MESVSYIKFLRISDKKIRGIAQTVVGYSPQQAIDKLMLVGNKAARLLLKAVISAKANSINNLKMNQALLKIKSIEIGKGPFYKRWQPISRGQVHSIKKRTSHIKIILSDEDTKKNKIIKKKEKQIIKSKKN